MHMNPTSLAKLLRTYQMESHDEASLIGMAGAFADGKVEGRKGSL